ncbi:MAG: leucine-rich repeat protein [Eubacteriales bacterium]|nr:leucine-rich repeat protein [Eubacteriales bacterium]
MKKKITLLLLSIVLMPCLLLLAACNKSVEFKINFIVDNEVYDTISTTGNTTISMPDDPIKEGYTFDGWYWDNDVWSRPFTANSLLDTPLVKDLRVYAKFNEIHVHSIVLIDAVEPTCTSSGNQKYYKCSTCNKLFSDETATTEITQIPVLAKLSHIYGDWQITKTATCTSDGLKIKKCTLCGETLQNEIINATGHTPSAWNITKQPTCTEYGTKIKTCTTCNAIVESENINPNGHVFSNWVITKQPTYTELGQEKRTCQNCSHYETRNIPTLTPTYVEPTSLILENGILKWNGNSPFGFELIVNNQLYIVQDNEFETTLKSDDYNSAKVACIYVDNTKSTYIELNNFIVNAPITNLHFVDDGTNVKFTWDSPSDLYAYTFEYGDNKNTVSKTQHYYTVPRNQLQKGTEVSIYVQGLASANFYPSKKYTITLEQLDAPNLKINKLNVEWDSILNAQEYKVQALNTLTQTSTTYNYDGANDGEYTITVTAFGSDYLNNSATLTFTKLKKPTINIEDNIVTWDAIAGQVRYAVLIDDVETKFVGNSYTITNTQDEYDIYLYASPVQPNTMQSDRVIISKFTYEDYSTVYWGTIINSTRTYTNVLNGNALYVPNQYLANMNLKNASSSRILIAAKVPTGFSSSLVSSIIIPNDTTEIVASAFSGCSIAISVTIPKSVTSIGNDAFYNCKLLTSITIPESVTSIGNYAFYNCTSLTGVYITNLDKWASIDFGNSDANPLYYVKKLYLNGTLVTEAILTNTTKISSFAFNNCTSLTSITIPESVTNIGSSAFSGCISLTNITIPESVTSIGKAAFYNCKLLTSITIPESVTNIGSSAFSGCSSLVEITIPFVGGSVSATSVSSTTLFGYIFGTNSYTGGTGIKQYYASGSYKTYYLPSSLRKITILGGNILDGAFYNCSMLTDITIPASVTRIGNDAFSGCTTLETINYNATRCSDLSSKNYVFNNAGQNGEGITINIGANVERIPAYLFGDRESYFKSPKIIMVTFAENSRCESIGNYAFYKCTSLTSVTIPESVTSIGNYAFEDCTSLTSITIPASVTSIEYSAFSDCTSLETINYNATRCSDLSLHNFVFDNAGQNGKGITVNIGANVERIPAYWMSVPQGVIRPKIITITFAENSRCESIGNYAFSGCTSLTSITIPESVTSIGSYAFRGCTSLETINYNATRCSDFSSSDGAFSNAGQSGAGITINIGANVERIPAYLFYNCTSLTSITIPASVTSIGSYAFYNCTSLTSVTIPESVTSIGKYAFDNCTSLTRVYYKGGESDWNNISINNSGNYNSYLTNATRYYYSEEKPINNGNYWHYVDGVVKVW